MSRVLVGLGEVRVETMLGVGRQDVWKRVAETPQARRADRDNQRGHGLSTLPKIVEAGLNHFLAWQRGGV